MSVNGPLILALVTMICVGVFLNGLRFARMTENPWAGKSIFGQPIQGGDLPIERVNLIGKVQMIFAPVFFVLFAAIISGLFGPVDFR